jgi:hypothetical protein
MTDTTHTMAGHLATAGAARVRTASLVPAHTAAVFAGVYGAAAQHQATGSHAFTSWTKGVIAEPATLMVLDRKNRPPRPLLERSP